MPLRFPCQPVALSAGGLLHSQWGATGFRRPSFDVYLCGPAGRVVLENAQIDTGSDYVVVASNVASRLRLSLPQPRQVPFSGAAGTQTGTICFPPNGLVSLFVTDYREYCYLPTPLIGFLPFGPASARQRSVLGLTGFLEFFRFVLDHGTSPPVFELHPVPGFPGPSGALPLDRPLVDFVRSLRLTP